MTIDEIRSILRDERVYHSLDLRKQFRFRGNLVLQIPTIYEAVGNCPRNDPGNGRNPCPPTVIKSMHCGVCIPNRHAFLCEHSGRGAFSHSDRTGKPEFIGSGDTHPSTRALRSASTTGILPNQA